MSWTDRVQIVLNKDLVSQHNSFVHHSIKAVHLRRAFYLYVRVAWKDEPLITPCNLCGKTDRLQSR